MQMSGLLRQVRFKPSQPSPAQHITEHLTYILYLLCSILSQHTPHHCAALLQQGVRETFQIQHSLQGYC